LGDRFQEEVRFAVSRLVENANIGPALSKRIRKLRLRTFPFNLIYAVEEDLIVIIAVAPHRRRPNYWRERLTNTR
jgi:toxin ParE1/3/4